MDITREMLMEYFRSDRFIDEMSLCDKNEIALACCSYSDYIYTKLEQMMTVHEKDEEGV